MEVDTKYIVICYRQFSIRCAFNAAYKLVERKIFINTEVFYSNAFRIFMLSFRFDYTLIKVLAYY